MSHIEGQFPFYPLIHHHGQLQQALLAVKVIKD